MSKVLSVENKYTDNTRVRLIRVSIYRFSSAEISIFLSPPTSTNQEVLVASIETRRCLRAKTRPVFIVFIRVFGHSVGKANQGFFDYLLA